MYDSQFGTLIPDLKQRGKSLQNLRDALLYVERLVAEKQIH